jgi:hypothetical protein
MSFNHLFLPLAPADAPLVYPPQLNLDAEKYEGYVPYAIPTKTVQTTIPIKTVQTTYTTIQTDSGAFALPPKTTTVYSQGELYLQPTPQQFCPCLHRFNAGSNVKSPADEHQIGNERKLRAKERNKAVRFTPIGGQPSPASIGRLDKRKRKNEEVCKWLANHAQEMNGTDFSLYDDETPSPSFKSLEL